MDEPVTPRDTPPPPPTPRRRRGWRVAAALFGLVLVLLFALVAGGWWTIGSERGSAWLASVLPGVRIEGAQGRLAGDFSARRVTIPLPGGSDTITLHEVAWRGLRIERATASRWTRITIDSLVAKRVDVAIAPSTTTEPATAPTDLRLPLELEVRALRVGELHATAPSTASTSSR